MKGPHAPMGWPRTKIRGARRKRKSAQRVTHRTEVLGVPVMNPDGSFVFRTVGREQAGAMRLVLTRVEDGWGQPSRQGHARRGGAGGG